MGLILLGVGAVAALVALVGWLMAHVRPAPAVVRDDVGPLVRTFPVPVGTLAQVVGTSIGGVRGASVARREGGDLIVTVRPSAGRLDDAMGLFVRIRLDARESGSAYVLTGQSRSPSALASRTDRALVAFERDLRMTMKKRSGLSAHLVV